MAVFITGAGGFIGSHLTECLVKKGYKVKTLIYYNTMNSKEWLDHIDPEVLSEIDIIYGDIRDLAFVRKAMTGCVGVIHLAALVGIPYSYVNPESYLDTNIKGTMNVLEASRDLNIQKIIHTSTSEVYGTAITVPINERHPLQGQSPYSASKIAADQMAYAYACSYNLPVVTLRPFNTFGPRQSLRAVIPTIITQFLRGEKNIKIGAISPTRDFSFITDTVSGFIAAYESKNTSLFGEVMNLGSGFEISIQDTINLIGKIFNRDFEVQVQSERMRPKNSEVERLWADNAKARKLLGWKPEYEELRGFEEALRKTVEWYSLSENLNKFSEGSYVI